VSKITTTVSPDLAALFVVERAANTAVDKHQREVLDAPAPEGMSAEERTQQVWDNNSLNDAWADHQYAIAQHPAETMSDLKGKLAFMTEHQMGDGQDWLPTILEDVQRIEPAETPEWSEALKLYEQATADNNTAFVVLRDAEHALEASETEKTKKAVEDAEAGQEATSDIQCDAIRGLLLPPAPSLSALLVNMQIAIDSGMIACGDIGGALATDLRRFSHYTNKEV
jgi:hypothetical protein